MDQGSDNPMRGFKEALRRGAQAFASGAGLNLPAIAAIGGAPLYFVDAAGARALDADFVALPNAGEAANSVGLSVIDHIAQNLRRGEMGKWSDFYERVFNFRQVRYFHISGKHTGLKTKAMASACGNIRIPLNESQDDRSQIEEFLRTFKGEGVQHIGLGADDIHASVERLHRRGIAFQATPDSYYEALPTRVRGHNEDMTRLKSNGILLDGDEEEGMLMQIFTRNAIGPMFFELIQRKGNQGFGEGNVTALFESVEADQISRGVLKAEAYSSFAAASRRSIKSSS
jgi:4-hydroxyphenylpyruvate dioxygenase